MKRLLLLSFILLNFSLTSYGTDYYLSESGNDNTNTGLSPSSPWQTINKINSIASSLKPGDKILFNRGDTFYGTLNITKSGTEGSPIIIGAYGTDDAKPVITGFTTMTDWVNEGNGVYSKTLSGISRLEVVTVDGRQYWMGQYPNTGYLTYESFNSNLSITDYELPATPNWTGAEIFIRKNFYSTVRAIITNQLSQTLNYSEIIPTSEILKKNFGYIIQNDLRTLNDFGDWCYKDSKLYLRFGSDSYEDHIIKVSTIEDLLYINGKNYITVENLRFSGCNRMGINATSVKNLIIDKCEFEYCGSRGIYLVWDITSSNITVNNSVFKKINCNAVEIFANNVVFTNNLIDSIGLQRGAAYGTNNGNGLYGKFNNGLIQYNEFSNIGHHGIYAYGNDFQIINNYIHNTVLEYLDAAAIYITHKGFKFTGQIIKDNIIIDAIGNNWGTNNFSSIWMDAEGIYLDNYNDNVTLDGNTVARCNQGIKLYESQGTVVKNNTIFNNSIQFHISNTNANIPLHPVRDLSINNNIAFAKEKDQLALHFSSVENDINLFGTSDYNYFARPIDDTDVFNIFQPATGTKLRTLEGWQSISGQDINSKKSPITISDTSSIDFHYNPSKTNKTIPLPEPMIDVKGTKYVNNVTLAPYSSIILMVDPNPVQPAIPVYQGAVVENTSPTVITLTYNISLNTSSVPAASSFTVLVNGTARTVSSVKISGSKVIITLSGPITYGDTVTISYSQPATNKLESTTFGAAASLTGQSVTNNIINPEIPNEAPVASVVFPETVYSGFIYELDASGSTDPDDDALTFSWSIPSGISVSATTGSKIRFLAPVLTSSRTYDFSVNVSDGRETQTKVLQINILPYKPDLGLASVSIIEASNYNSPDNPQNVNDGSLLTKWSVLGENQWLTISLTDPYKINYLQMGLLPDQKYSSYFDIYASKDNRIWDPVFLNKSSCDFSGNLQNIDFPADKTNTDYSYVKLVGHGSALDTWNRYSEIRLFGLKGEHASPDRSNISLYPNPTRGDINIIIQEPGTESHLLRIFDLGGRLRFETWLDPTIYNIQVTPDLPGGAYIVQILLGSIIVFTKTLIVIR